MAFTWDGDAEPPTRVQAELAGREPYTDLTFKVTVLGPEAEWPGFAEFLERTWGRALDNMSL